MSMLISLVVFLWLEQAPWALANTGSASCPCIDPGIAVQQANSTALRNNDLCLVRIGNAPDYGFQCFNKAYGSSQCLAWDENDPRCSGSECSKAWCWVDRTSCGLAFEEVDAFSQRLFRSYATCDASPVQETVPPQSYAGQTIRIAFPSGFEKPYYYKVSTRTRVKNGEGKWVTGAIVDLALDVLQAANISYTVHKVPKVSSQLYPTSSFTACVQAVGMGYVDMCIGPFWATAERQALTPMGGMVFSTSMVFISIPSNEADFWLQATRMFSPFTWQLWVTLICMVFFFGMLTWWNAFFRHRKYGQTPVTSVFLAMSVFCPNANQPRVMGRALFLTLAFVVLVTTSTYQASLTSFLVVDSIRQVQLTDMNSAIHQTKKICLLQSAVALVLNQYPKANSSGIMLTKSSTANAIKGVLDGECIAALVTSDHAKRAEKGLFDNRCSLLASSVPVLGVYDAFPMHISVRESFNYWQRKVLENETWETWVDKYPETPKCKPPVRESSSAVGASQMLGLWLVLAVLVGVWVLVTIARLVGRQFGWHEKLPEERDFHAVFQLDDQGADPMPAFRMRVERWTQYRYCVAWFKDKIAKKEEKGDTFDVPSRSAHPNRRHFSRDDQP